MKFLILRFSSIGDIVLTTPVIRCIKKQIVTAEVHYAVFDRYRPVLAANPYIDRIHSPASDGAAFVRQLQSADFDYVIDLHHNLRTLKIRQALGKKSFAFNKLNIEKWVYTNFKINLLPRVHIVDRYLDTVKTFGVTNDGAGLDYFIPDAEHVKEEDIPASHHAGYVAIAIGAALNTKKLPLNKLKDLCAGLDHPVILLGGKEDMQAGDVLSATDPHKIYNACGRFNINESADLIRRSKAVITHDTGLMHIAAAFRKPVISVWGNTVPEFGMYPYYGDNYMNNYAAPGVVNVRATNRALPYDIIEIRKLYCRPCSKIGYKKCPEGHFYCMHRISVSEILSDVNRRLGKEKS